MVGALPQRPLLPQAHMRSGHMGGRLGTDRPLLQALAVCAEALGLAHHGAKAGRTVRLRRSTTAVRTVRPGWARRSAPSTTRVLRVSSVPGVCCVTNGPETSAGGGRTEGLAGAPPLARARNVGTTWTAAMRAATYHVKPSLQHAGIPATRAVVGRHDRRRGVACARPPRAARIDRHAGHAAQTHGRPSSPAGQLSPASSVSRACWRAMQCHRSSRCLWAQATAAAGVGDSGPAEGLPDSARPTRVRLARLTTAEACRIYADQGSAAPSPAVSAAVRRSEGDRLTWRSNVRRTRPAAKEAAVAAVREGGGRERARGPAAFVSRGYAGCGPGGPRSLGLPPRPMRRGVCCGHVTLYGGLCLLHFQSTNG